MPGTPGQFRESLTAKEVFPRSLPAQTHQFQLRELPERLLRRKMRLRGKLVYMHLGTIVQQSEQSLARFVRFYLRPARLGRRTFSWGYVHVPPQLDAQVSGIGHLAGDGVAKEHSGTFGEQ